MDFTITVNVSVEHVEDTPNDSKDAVRDGIINRLQLTNPGEIVSDNGARYKVTIWDAEEA